MICCFSERSNPLVLLIPSLPLRLSSHQSFFLSCHSLSPHYGSFLSGIPFFMKFESIAALLAVSVQSANAFSTLSTRVGVSTTTVTATSFQTATSTVTSVAEVTSVTTTCAVGSTAPTGQAWPYCTESVWSSAGAYYQQHCSAALVGGTTIRGYVFPSVQGFTQAVSICSILNNVHNPASSCAGINFMTFGAIGQYYIVNGDVTLKSTDSSRRVVQPFTTNPCELTATATVTDLSPTVETSTLVYTSTFEVSYLETITVSIADPTTSSTLMTSTMSSSAVMMNTTSTAMFTESTSLPVNASSALSLVPHSEFDHQLYFLNSLRFSQQYIYEEQRGCLYFRFCFCQFLVDAIFPFNSQHDYHIYNSNCSRCF